jgi:hypothetical protein
VNPPYAWAMGAELDVRTGLFDLLYRKDAFLLYG